MFAHSLHEKLLSLTLQTSSPEPSILCLMLSFYVILSKKLVILVYA